MSTIRLAGVEVPRVGLGTNRLHDTPEHARFIADAVDAGLRHIDTAHLYTGGESERAIGASGVTGRDDVVVATKGAYKAGQGRAEVIAEQVEQSLQALKVDAIDLWYLHRVDPETPFEQTLEAIKAHVDVGRIKHFGLSAVTVDEIKRAQEVLPVAAVQNEFNLDHSDDHGVIDFCEQEDIVFVPFFPLRGGSGSNEEKLAWLLDRSPVVLPIPGTLSLDHLKQNLAALS